MNELVGLVIATIVTWFNFILIDTCLGLPEQPGVKGANNIAQDIKKRGGDLSGGFFQGNVLNSLDATAGTLFGCIGVYLLGFQGGIIAMLLVYMGTRLCADPGYSGTMGALSITIIIYILSFVGLTPEMFVVGMVIAILTIQGLYHPSSSKLIGKIAKAFGRYTKLE